MSWITCHDPRVRLRAGHRADGRPYLHGIRNPSDEERLMRVVRPDGTWLIELLLPPGASASLVGDEPSLSSWEGLYPLVGDFRVEVWQD